MRWIFTVGLVSLLMLAGGCKKSLAEAYIEIMDEQSEALEDDGKDGLFAWCDDHADRAKEVMERWEDASKDDKKAAEKEVEASDSYTRHRKLVKKHFKRARLSKKDKKRFRKCVMH